MKDRNNCCPKCSSKLLARIGGIVYCLSSSCDWAIQSKRKDDSQIKEINQLKQDWQ